jgi:ribosomal protein S21
MAINVQVSKNNNENAASVLRRFMKKVRGAGFLQEVRNRRSYVRTASKLRRKKSRLVQLERAANYQELDKLGKITKE